MDISRFGKTPFAMTLATVILLGCVLADPAWSGDQGDKAKSTEAKEGGGAEASKDSLSGNEYVTLRPFVIPLIEKGKFRRRQFVLVLALKLAYEDARDKVLLRIPKIRDAIYPELYRRIGFRQNARRMMDKEQLRERLSPIVLANVSRKLVSELVVHKAFVSRAP